MKPTAHCRSCAAPLRHDNNASQCEHYYKFCVDKKGKVKSREEVREGVKMWARLAWDGCFGGTVIRTSTVVSVSSKTMKNSIIVAVVALLIQGCATSYQSSGFTGGYSEVQLDENVFKVSFKGNAYTRESRTTDFTLMRSAELTLGHGFKYFAIIDERSATHTYTTPTTYNTTSNLSGGFTTTTTGGYTLSKPSISNTIVLYEEKPSEFFTYNAKFLLNNMKAKYGVE